MAAVAEASCRMLPATFGQSSLRFAGRKVASLAQGPSWISQARLGVPSFGFTCRRTAMSIFMASKVDPPNVGQLCEKARLSLAPEEVKDFEPQIRRIVDWFGQLQDVDLIDISPAIRVGIGKIDASSTLRPDVAKNFSDREAMLASAPDRAGPYLKVPRILKENQE